MKVAKDRSNSQSQYEIDKWLESCMGLLCNAESSGEAKHCGFVGAWRFAVDIKEDNS